MTALCLSASFLHGQVFVQVYTNSFYPNTLINSVGNASLHVLNGKQTLLKVNAEVLDSNFNSQSFLSTKYHAVSDSLFLGDLFETRKTTQEENNIKALSKIFIRYTILDEEDNSIGEFLYEYSRENTSRQPDEKTKKDGPVSIHGQISCNYQYTNANYPGSVYPKNLFVYSMSPEISLWNIPIKGNLRIVPGNTNFRQLFYSNFQLDANKLGGLKRTIENRVRQQLEEESEKLKNDLEKEISKRQSEIQSKIAELQSQIEDSLSHLMDTSFISDSIERVKSYRPTIDTAGYMAEVPDSIYQSQKEKYDSISRRLDSLKKELDQLEVWRDSVYSLYAQKDSLVNKGFSMKSRLSGSNLLRLLDVVEVKRLSVGTFYPSLPKLVQSQASVNGLDVAFSKQSITHEVSVGKIANFNSGQKGVEFFRYSIGWQKDESTFLKTSLVYNTSLGSRNSFVRNPILDVEYDRVLVKNGILNFSGELAVTKMTSFNTGYTIPGSTNEDTSTRNQVLQINRHLAPGYSGRAQLKGELAGFTYTAEFQGLSQGFTTVLNPYKINGLNRLTLSIQKSLLKNLLKLSAQSSWAKENSLSIIKQYKVNVKMSPKRLPRLSLTYQNYSRAYSLGSQQSTQLLNARSSYLVRIGGLVNTLQASFSLQKSNYGNFMENRNMNVIFSDQMTINKKSQLSIHYNYGQIGLMQNGLSNNRVQSTISCELSYLLKENLYARIRSGYIDHSVSKNITSGVTLGGHYKKLNLDLSYDYNSMTPKVENLGYPQVIHRFQTTLAYAF
ncbi:MAG: hypothetical protein GC180_12845 [Bacteroidetes bacterium]|nr:hypothetical protein [Bacteroidota bacterium]